MEREIQKEFKFQDYSVIEKLTKQENGILADNSQENAKAVAGQYALCLYRTEGKVINRISLKNESEFTWDSLKNEDLVNPGFMLRGYNNTVLIIDAKKHPEMKKLATVFHSIANKLLDTYLEFFWSHEYILHFGGEAGEGVSGLNREAEARKNAAGRNDGEGDSMANSFFGKDEESGNAVNNRNEDVD